MTKVDLNAELKKMKEDALAAGRVFAKVGASTAVDAASALEDLTKGLRSLSQRLEKWAKSPEAPATPAPPSDPKPESNNAT